MGLKPTDEQLIAREYLLSGGNLAIEALAGTGKTTLLRMMVDDAAGRGDKILYTTFGKKSAEDAKARFPRTCAVRTNHSLAWGVGVKYQQQGRLGQRIQPRHVVEKLRLIDSDFAPYTKVMSGAFGVIETLNNFCQSSDDMIGSHHATDVAMKLARQDPQKAGHLIPTLTELAKQLWIESMFGGATDLAVTHDMYLKQWALSKPKLRFNTILLDEAQDTNGVMIGVLREQKHAQIVVVGDRRQAIYGFRGAVNAMDAFDIRNRTNLTRSFRFGPEIAEVANAVLIDQCASDVLLQGDTGQPGLVAPVLAPACVLARTNAQLIGELFSVLDVSNSSQRIAVIGGVSDLVDLVEGARALQQGQQTAHADLAEFVSWDDVVDAAGTDAYGHLRVLAELVQTHGTANLRSNLEHIRGNEKAIESCTAAFSTAHKAKGAEFESVRLADDFMPKGPDPSPELFGWSPEEGNLLYVACTRARRQLDIVGCAAVTSSLSKVGLKVSEHRACAVGAGESRGDAFDGYPDLDLPSSPFDVLDGLGSHGVTHHAEPLDPFGLVPGVWEHPLIADGKIEISKYEEGTQVIVRASGYILFQSIGDVEELGATTKRVTVRVGTAHLDVPPDSIVDGCERLCA